MICPFCQHAESWPIDAARAPDVEAILHASGRRFDRRWRLCAGCGNAFPTADNDPAVLEQIWNANRKTDRMGEAEARRVWEYRKHISSVGATRTLQQYKSVLPTKPGRFLDIGCGLGYTVRAFADLGWDAAGIDADPGAAAFHRELGITTTIGTVETLPLSGPYDVILISHAIYFIANPLAFLERIRGLLTPDGIFCVSIADFMANTDDGLPGYAHSFYPTGQSMQYMLGLTGFTIKCSSRRSGTIYIAAQPGAAAPLPSVSPRCILFGYRTKTLRYRLIGRPYLTLRQAAKRLLQAIRP